MGKIEDYNYMLDKVFQNYLKIIGLENFDDIKGFFTNFFSLFPYVHEIQYTHHLNIHACLFLKIISTYIHNI